MPEVLSISWRTQSIHQRCERTLHHPALSPKHRMGLGVQWRRVSRSEEIEGDDYQAVGLSGLQQLKWWSKFVNPTNPPQDGSRSENIHRRRRRSTVLLITRTPSLHPPVLGLALCYAQRFRSVCQQNRKKLERSSRRCLPAQQRMHICHTRACLPACLPSFLRRRL